MKPGAPPKPLTRASAAVQAAEPVAKAGGEARGTRGEKARDGCGEACRGAEAGGKQHGTDRAPGDRFTGRDRSLIYLMMKPKKRRRLVPVTDAAPAFPESRRPRRLQRLRRRRRGPTRGGPRPATAAPPRPLRPQPPRVGRKASPRRAPPPSRQTRGGRSRRIRAADLIDIRSVTSVRRDPVTPCMMQIIHHESSHVAHPDRLRLAVALLAVAPLPAAAAVLTRKGQKAGITGEITKISKTEVTIKPKTKDAETIPVNEIVGSSSTTNPPP